MSGIEALVRASREPAAILLRDVRAIDPRAGLSECVDVRVAGGRVAAVAAPRSLEPQVGDESLEGGGSLALMPAFFDPHVHLRSPGQEHKEDIESGTRA